MNEESRTNILIIEDDPVVRQSMADYLEDLEYRILTAEDGRAGLGLFDRESVDLALVDLRMPEMDGLAVLAQVTKASPETPLIVVSGTGAIADAIEALHHGAWDYILKPIEDLSVLAHAIENALEKARLKRENLQYQRHLEQMVSERTVALRRANTHLTHINARLRQIVETTRRLSLHSEVETFASQLLIEFGRHMLATGGSLYVREPGGLRLVHALDPGHAAEWIPFPLPGESVFQKVVAEKKPVWIRDIARDSGLCASGWPHYKDGSALVFPLLDEGDEVTAILTLHSKAPRPFVEQDKEIGSILASYSRQALRAVRAAEDLRRSEQQFRSILDTIRTGILIVESSSMRIIYANPTAAEMIEASAEEMIGRRCHDVLCLAEDGRCPMLDLGERIDSAERLLQTSSGRQLPVLQTTARMICEGKECLLESFVDLTRQKAAAAEKEALERQLRQAQKMEALGTLAGGVAHDFNNILSAVIGYAELCFIDLQGPSHPAYQKLEGILRAGNRAKALVGQILTFSRMQEQMMMPVRIAPIVSEALKLLKASLPANIQLVDQITTQARVLADPTQIHQVIMNLCTNAYHAMEENGGRLLVSLTTLSAEDLANMPQVEVPPGEYLRLTVEDTGTGISPAVMESIFDPYFTTKEKDKGTGLGLAVVHGIVKGHRGAISVNSRIGEGTAVHVVLPTTVEASDGEARDRGTLPRGSESILFVDDEKDLVDIGCQMLVRLGYEVTGVMGSTEALGLFRRSPERFDLVISDVNMPTMGGERLARELKRIRPDLPIILCTGFSDRFDQDWARALGIRECLMKPLAMNILAESVRAILDESQSSASSGA